MNDRTRTIALGLVVVIGMTCAALLVRRLDTLRPPDDPNAIDESLYVNGKTARRISLGFNGLAADWYWMRSLQYVGRKIINDNDVPIDNLGLLNLKLLAPLLDTATTLDPEFQDPYEYAAIVLPAINVDDAIRITKKGVDANPNVWRFYHHLGYIYWQQHDYQAASEWYGRGAQIEGAPPWMEAMKAKMAADGGSRATAREIALKLLETCRVAAEPLTATDLAHGPVAALDPSSARGRSPPTTRPCPRCSKRPRPGGRGDADRERERRCGGSGSGLRGLSKITLAR